MREYKKVTKTYQDDELTKCTCDRCGKECDTTDKHLPKYANINIRPYWASDVSEYFQLCSECTIELLSFFIKADKETIEELKDDMKFWLED